MKVSVDLEILEKYLPSDELAAILESVKITRENHKGYMKKWRENHRGNVKITRENHTENRIFGEKTQFSAPRGGVGGALGSKIHVRSVPEDDVTKLIETKEENLLKINKDNFANITKKEKMNYWKKTREKFEPYWIIYPSTGRLELETCLKRFSQIQGTIPNPAFLCGFIHWLKDNKWEAIKPDYVPKMIQFLNNEDWNSIEAKAKASINRNIAHWQQVVQKKIEQYKGGAI